MRSKLLGIIASAVIGLGCLGKQETEDDYFEPCRRIHQEIQYKKEPEGVCYFQSPRETKKLKTGDCEDFALYLIDEWRKKGIKGNFVVGVAYIEDILTKPKTLHAWCEVTYKNEVYIVDPTTNYYFQKNSIKSNIIYLKILSIDGDFILNGINKLNNKDD